ncbi:AAA family ATPase [Novosphingobium sp.]|uniref:AAA family ATPase n=1 Tax=Novosphingobium sp. TaxID=1874826 RepID=UPI002FDECEAE
MDGLWLIDEWLPKQGIAAVYGHPGTGKSFLALDMAAHVASGSPWAGRHVERGLVLYVVAEGQTGFRNRLFAMQQAGQIARDAPFAFIPTPIDMQAPDGDLPSLLETIRAATDQAGLPIAMLVIDTLSKTFGAGKENTDDMAGYVANCQRVASAFDCLTVIVHHRPKDGESRDLRGHSSLRGGLETMILVEAGDIKTATTLKQKDGEDNVAVRFKLERVVIGVDKRGKEISTCLTHVVDGVAAPAPKHPMDVKRAGLSGHKKTALRTIEDIIERSGVNPPSEIPTDSIDRYRTWKAVDAAAVSERLKNEFYALEDGDEEKRRDNSRRNANRALKDLKSLGVIGSFGEWIWLN